MTDESKKIPVYRRSSCDADSTYRPDVLSSELQIAIEMFLDIMWRAHPHRREYKWVAKRGYYTYTIHRKYVEIFCGAIRTFRISRGGAIYGWKARGGVHGNVFDIVEAKRNGKKIVWDGDQSIVIEGEECGDCGNTKFVVKTVVGPRCSRCRGSLQRHVNAVRYLGGTPTFQGRPVQSIVECR